MAIDCVVTGSIHLWYSIFYPQFELKTKLIVLRLRKGNNFLPEIW